MPSDAQKRATAKYRKENTVTKSLRFFPGDKDVLEHLEKQPNMAGYIKELIRRDMDKVKL